MFVMTPALVRMTKEYADKMLADKKQQKVDYLAARDAKLKSHGLENCDKYFVQKIAEVKQIAESVEQQAVEEAEEMLELFLEASEAVVSEAASEHPSKETQTSALPSPFPTQTSPSNDSDLDDVPIGQRMKKLQKPSPKPQQTIPQLPLQEKQTSAAAEGSEDPEEPTFSNLPTCDSPLNLHSLEKHLGGELQETPEKATKAVPEKTDLVNQQQPEPPQQTTHEQTLTSTQITQTQTTSSPQKTIPEPVVETVVPESVPAIESEQTVAIIVSEPIQTTTQPSSTAITNDQPSSSSSTIQTLQQPPPPNMLKSEFMDTELMAITTEVQRLVE